MARELTPFEQGQAKVLKMSDKAVGEHLQTLAVNGLDRTQFTEALHTSIRANPSLVEQDPTSLMMCLRKSVLDGLLPDGDQAALIPFGKGVQYLRMVNGLKAMAWRDLRAEISTEVIYEGMEVSMIRTTGEDPKTTIRQDESFFSEEPQKIIGAICTCRVPELSNLLEIRWRRKEIEAAKSKSATANNPNGPWNTWEAAMVEKAIVKSMCNKIRYLAIAKDKSNFIRVIDEDNQEEREGFTVDVSPEPVPEATPALAQEAEVVAEPKTTRSRGRPKGSRNKPKPAPAPEPEYIEASPASEPTPASEESGDEMAFQLPPEPPPGDEDDYEREPGSDDDKDEAPATKKGGIAL